MDRRIWLDLGMPNALMGNHGPNAIDAYWQDHGLSLLRTILHAEGLETDLASTRLHPDWRGVGRQVIGYDMLLMNVRSYHFGIAKTAAKQFKQLNPEGVVVVGGMHATVSPGEMEAVGDFDHICKGPGENSIVDLVRDPSAFPKLFDGAPSKSMEDWPRMDRTLWPKPGAPPQDSTWPLEASCGWGPPPVATIISSRVCPWRCSFSLATDTIIHTIDGSREVSEYLKMGVSSLQLPTWADGHIESMVGNDLRITGKDKPVLLVLLTDGTSFRATPDHPVLLLSGDYVDAVDLKGGEALMSLHQPLSVADVRDGGRSDVFDIAVPPHNNFAVAGGVFVHNCNEASYIDNMERRSVDSVIEELNWLDEKHGPLGSVVFHDSMFFQKPSWLEEWAEKYPRKANAPWPYWAAARADTVHKWPELFETLVRDTNWRTISIGFESGSERSLEILNKECTPDDNAFTIELLNKIGDDLTQQGMIRPRFWANIMWGIPGETQEGAFQTMKMFLSMKEPIPTFAYYAPFAGSILGNQLIAEGKSLMPKDDHTRYAGQPKISGVDYQFYADLLAGKYQKEVEETVWP